MTNTIFLSISISHAIFGIYLSNKVFVIYVKFKFEWEFCFCLFACLFAKSRMLPSKTEESKSWPLLRTQDSGSPGLPMENPKVQASHLLLPED